MPMFYVEQFMNYLFLLVFLLACSSCKQRDDAPEKKDLVYLDLAKELELTQKSISSAEKELTEGQQLLSSVIPQSGQLQPLEKKVFSFENNLARLKQQRQFFEIKLELRKSYVFKKYEESLNGGKPWPDLEEIKNYQSSLKLNRDKIDWDKNKGIVKSVPRGTTSNENKKQHDSPEH